MTSLLTAPNPVVHETTVRHGAAGHELYRQLDEEINGRLGTDVGFTALVRATPYPMDVAVVDGFRERYATIKRFQESTLALFNASLRGECDPEIAAMVLGDVPAHLGSDYHRQLTARQHHTPVFFRTDEPLPSKLSEIQCPGSGWCLAEEVQTLYRNNAQWFGGSKHFRDSLAASFAGVLRARLGGQPLVHHLVDNASRPHGMRYFIQRTREQGIKYFSYDRDVAASDCNFVRSHDFFTLPHHNFFTERMERCEQGALTFDLSPSALFDGKLILAWPFWRKTREVYEDQIRQLFPFTTVIDPDGFELSNGQQITLDEFFRIGRGKRDYYIKYGGTDVTLNWGSKSVFLASTLTKAQCGTLRDTIVKDHRRGRYWICQESLQHRETVPALARDGGSFEVAASSKFSGFYGPEGVMAILVMQKPSHKVHGSAETILSVVP